MDDNKLHDQAGMLRFVVVIFLPTTRFILNVYIRKNSTRLLGHEYAVICVSERLTQDEDKTFIVLESFAQARAGPSLLGSLTSADNFHDALQADGLMGFQFSIVTDNFLAIFEVSKKHEQGIANFFLIKTID